MLDSPSTPYPRCACATRGCRGSHQPISPAPPLRQQTAPESPIPGVCNAGNRGVGEGVRGWMEVRRGEGGKGICEHQNV